MKQSRHTREEFCMENNNLPSYPANLVEFVYCCVYYESAKREQTQLLGISIKFVNVSNIVFPNGMDTLDANPLFCKGIPKSNKILT